MSLRKTTASGMALVTMGGSIRLPRVKLPPLPTPPIERAEEPPASVPMDEPSATERVIVVGRADSAHVLTAIQDLVAAGLSFAYCDASQVPGLLEQIAQLLDPADVPLVITVRGMHQPT